MRIRDRFKAAWLGFIHGSAIFRDEPTGVLNRLLLWKIGEKLFTEAKRYGREFTCVMIDIDELKLLNDITQDHQRVDALLREFAQVLFQQARKADFVFRYGGDEFLFLLPETQEKDAYILMERIEKNLPLIDMDNCIFLPETLQFSFGVVNLGKESTLQEMVLKADKLMYSNKIANKAERRKIKGE